MGRDSGRKWLRRAIGEEPPAAKFKRFKNHSRLRRALEFAIATATPERANIRIPEWAHIRWRGAPAKEQE